MSTEAQALARQIIHAVNLGECWEDPAHEAEIAIVAKMLTAALAAERRRVWEEVEKICDSNLRRDANTEFGIGYQAATKEISLYAECRQHAEVGDEC